MTPLSLRTLNRTYLTRQHLLTRAALSIPAAVEHLIGLQAQLANPPYLGLWTRLAAFDRAALTAHMADRQIVRAAFWRSTLHLVTAADHNRLRPLVEPALRRALASFFGRKSGGIDVPGVLAAARAALTEQPLTMGELKTHLRTIAPDADGDALNYIVRTELPLVQVYPGGTWGSSPQTRYVLAADYLPAGPEPLTLRALFERYLAAYGPASIADFQTWTGLTKLDAAPLTAGLTVYRGPDAKPLYDVPGLPLTAEDTPAPVRFIPEYDNCLIGHADRTRILPAAYRQLVFLSAARVLNTFLVDGFSAGTWRLTFDTRTQHAELQIAPFAPLPPDALTPLHTEGERLIRFVHPTAATVSITGL